VIIRAALAVAPERIWKWGERSGAKRLKKILLVVPLHFFGSKNTISRFDERFRNGHYSLVSFLFAVLLLTVPPCPMESAPPHTCRGLLSLLLMMYLHSRTTT